MLAYGWVLVSAYYLPPRGVDDLAYHLPAVFEYVQAHGIRLLPVGLHSRFAFPENAELLFMWPTLFSHSQRMVNSINVPFVFVSIATVYALLRHFGTSRKDSLFASMLYAVCPMILMQAGSNYIDMIVSLFFLLSLYYALEFHRSPRRMYLYAAGAAIGLMCGMKYTAVFLAVPLQVMILPKLARVKMRHAFGYAALAVVLCGWWYLRNGIVLGDPFYPMNLLAPLLGHHGSGGDTGILRNMMSNRHYWMLHYPLDDDGIGSFDGGFGLLFWGICFPSWLYIAAYSAVNFRRTGLAKAMFLLQLPAGFLLLLALPPEYIPYSSRFAIFVVAPGLFAFCSILTVVNDRMYVSAIKFVCILMSVLSVSLMSTSKQPSYRLDSALSDKVAHRNPSEYKYVMDSIEGHAALRFVWEPLDFLTRDDRPGLNCYVATQPQLFATAPVYGYNLQNRVLNMNGKDQGPVGAYVYTYLARDLFGHRLKPPNLRLNDRLNIQDILASNAYIVVSQSECGSLILDRMVYAKPEKQRLLLTYYRDTWPDAEVAARQILPALREDIPIVTSCELGYGVRCVDIGRNRSDRVLMVPELLENDIASHRKMARCYTFCKPLPGYKYKKIAGVVYKNKNVDIFLNVLG